MNTHADKTQNGKSQSVASDMSQLHAGGESIFQFEDNRPEIVAQWNLQKMANNSPRTKQLKAFQEMANNSTQAKQAAQFQAMANNHSDQQQPIQKKENNTGLPDNFKSGIENLSGYSMDDVKVHRNSDKPTQLQAHAYAQGTEIHLGPGQEKHLGHEAWHVVQQKQGRVKPTMQMKGKVNINDDAGLEKEADVVGEKAVNSLQSVTAYSPFPTNTGKHAAATDTIQPKWVENGKEPMYWDGLLDGIQWYYIVDGVDAGKMFYRIIDKTKIKPSMFESYDTYQNTSMSREFWSANSAFGDIYGVLDASVITEDEATDGILAPAWFQINPESMKGIWLQRILDMPFGDIEVKFREYLAIVYGDDVMMNTSMKLEMHIENIISEIKDAKRFIEMLKPAVIQEKAKAIEITNKHLSVIIRLIPTVPDAGTRILGNIEDIRSDKEGGGNEGIYKLTKNGGWVMTNKTGETVQANGEFVFVVPVDSKEVVLGRRSHGGHTVVSRGGDVYFAGEMVITDGDLMFWDNESGHYRTPKEQVDVLEQIGLAAVLPIDKFKERG